MKLKYKQIIAFIIIILFSSLPLSLFILNQQEKEKINLLVDRGRIDCRILARSSLNILLMNGGDIGNTRLDTGRMMSILSSLKDDGLVYADTILISSKKEYNGLILASYRNYEILKTPLFPDLRVPHDAMKVLMSQGDFTEKYVPGIKDRCYEFVIADSLQGRPSICVGRLIFSKNLIHAPIKRLRYIIYGVILTAIVLVSLMGLVFGRIISRPVDELIQGVENVGSGDFNYRLPVKSRNEFGRLATTINHFIRIINLEINELQRANRELKKLDILKDEFLANISHELRTPLYGIIGLSESMTDGIAGLDDTLKEKIGQDLALITMSAKRLSQLINNILDFSKLKHGDIELDFTSVDMCSVTQLIISMLSPSVIGKSLVIENSIPPESVYVEGDNSRLQQIMLNLIGNAVKFTESGTITVSSTPYVENSGNEFVRITISDSGIGIPEEKYALIFESFVQADGSAERHFPGFGLGLSISKKIIELHGGKIWIEPNATKGSRINFTLRKTAKPAALPEPAELEISDHYFFSEEELKYLTNEKSLQERIVANYQGDVKEHILVIDDEPIIKRILKKSLEQSGYTVTTATYGDEALKIIEEGPIPDLIILDVMLPRMSGYDVSRIIRKTYPAHELPILMLTAKAKPGEMITGFEAGANDYITKPLEREVLLARVKSLISLKNSARLTNTLNLIKYDLQVAHDIQQTVMLKRIPEVPGLDIAVRYLPMEQLGGDFYDIHRIDENRIAVLIADVSGHGIPAAFICAMLKVIYSFHVEQEQDPALLMKNINATMLDYTNDQYVTALFAVIDMKEKIIYHASGGHWPLLILKNNENIIQFSKSRGIPFGWEIGSDYKTLKNEFKKGDRLVFYTDGIIEARNPAGEMYWTERFHDIIKKNRTLAVEDFADSVVEDVKNWTGSTEGIRDDITLLVLDVTDQNPGTEPNVNKRY